MPQRGRPQVSAPAGVSGACLPSEPGTPAATQGAVRRPSPALLALLAWLCLAPAMAGAALPTAVDGQPLPSLAPMLQRVTPAVVNIATRGAELVRESPLMRDPFFRYFFDLPSRIRERPTQSQGSGVIVDAASGYIITNHHVIEGARDIGVTLRDGRELPARLVGSDPDTDVAVIQVQAPDLVAAQLSDSDRLQVGDFVVAIGNPFGLGQTVTSGIVSALGRTGLGIEGYEDFIQTDASINVGNSGGALVNLRGELVGINTAMLAPSGGNVGIGFAIPTNMAVSIMQQLVTHGRVRRGLLGVVAQDVTPALADAFGVQPGRGAVVVEVMPESAAAGADVRPGDVLLAVNGRPIASSADVRNQVGLLRVGETVHLDLVRNGQPMQVSAVLLAAAPTEIRGEALHPSLSGATFADLPADHPLHGELQAVLVAAVRPGTAAAVRGLRPGDLIMSANRIRVRGIDELQTAAGGDGPLVLNIRRGQRSVMVLVR